MCCLYCHPDDGDDEGAEASILKVMGFKQFKYTADGVEQQPVQVNTVAPKDKVKYILSLLSSGPVLVLCNGQLAEALGKVVPRENTVNVQSGVDYGVLRALDVKVGSLYRLVVCTDEFGIRGIDYRSPNVALTLSLIHISPKPQNPKESKEVIRVKKGKHPL